MRHVAASTRTSLGWGIVFVASCVAGLCLVTTAVLLLALRSIW